MAFVVKDRVKVSSTTTGTGTFTLGAASSGFQDFSVVGNGNTTSYAIVDNNTGAWEVGIGTYTASGTLLSRDTVLESSTGGAKVSFAAGAKDVFVTYPAETSVTDLGISRPTIRPSLLLDFANTEALDPRITFARASEGRFYGTQTAKAEENLLLQSQDITTTWTNVGSTDSADTTTAPDGTSTADTLTETATISSHDIRQTGVAVTSGLRYVWSMFAKKGDGATAPDIIQLTWATGGFGVTVFANYDISVGGGTSGTVTTTGAGAVSASIVNVGNGWYRCVLIADATATATSGMSVLLTNNNPTATRGQSYLGVTTANVFLWGAQLEQRASVTAYTPTTTQPITNYIPVLQTAASGVARFDHNPNTFESLGLLIEEQRTNLTTYSDDFANAAWGKTNLTIASNTIVAPDGTLTGDKHIPDSGATIGTGATQTRLAQGNYSRTAGVSYTVTAYAKRGELNSFRIADIETGNNKTGNYDLVTGVASVVSGTATASMTPVGNGWYRCVLTWVQATTESQQTRFTAFDTVVTTGNGFSGIFIWGAQLEAGAFPTSYIPTVASQVTRSADAASMTGANFTSWYSGGAGTVYSESAVYAAAVKTQGVWDLLGGATSTSLRSPQATDPRLRAFVGGTFSGVGAGPAITNNAPIKATVAWQGLSGRLQSGSTGVDVTAVANLDATQLLIGSLISSGSNSLNGTLKKLAFYPARLTNAELQGITS